MVKVEGSWGWSCCSTDWSSLKGNGCLDIIIVLEDIKEYISYAPKDEIKVQERRPFDLLVIINPKLQKKSNRTAVFFEGCLR
ncbi:putative peptide deformylase [Rosa chinensis]|uniref:Putative peptide deformylase n=1 Tax=Rosa chinensis TaxID=74649 RepID=A0A2P6S3E1_ROSCH|nr:putative peptide deformylase [Rosa chinensis]